MGLVMADKCKNEAEIGFSGSNVGHRST